MIDRLFEYGSLTPSRPSEHVVTGVPDKWEPLICPLTILWAPEKKSRSILNRIPYEFKLLPHDLVLEDL